MRYPDELFDYEFIKLCHLVLLFFSNLEFIFQFPLKPTNQKNYKLFLFICKI